jgi:hypothetical protein
MASNFRRLETVACFGQYFRRLQLRQLAEPLQNLIYRPGGLRPLEQKLS